MNACKHRKICEATRDCLRLRPKGKQSGSGPSTWPDANTRTAGVKSEPKSSCDCCGTWKRSYIGQQMMANASWLMRPDALLWSSTGCGCLQTIVKLFGNGRRVNE